MARCEATMEWDDGYTERCARDAEEGGLYCLHHQKYVDYPDYFPAPTDWKGNGAGKLGQNRKRAIVAMLGKNRRVVRRFDYKERMQVNPYRL